MTTTTFLRIARYGIYGITIPLLALLGLLGFDSPSSRSWAQTDDSTKDLALLRTANLPTKGPDLLKYLRTRIITPEDRARVEKLIRQLGDEDYQKREEAASELLRLSSISRALLVQSKRDKDPEIAKQSKELLAEIGRNSKTPIVTASIRLLSKMEPEGTVETFLAYLPDADDPDIAFELTQGLLRTGVKKGKVDPLVIQATTDKAPSRRAVAGEVLARLGGKEFKDKLQKLLSDADPLVRRSVATAMLESKDKEGIPVLIALLTAPGHADAVEEALNLLPGENMPIAPFGADEDARLKYRKDWEAWWRSNEGKVDLSKIDAGSRFVGHTLISYRPQPVAKAGVVRNQWKLLEVDQAGQVRWEFNDPNQLMPVFAQVVKRDRILIVERNNNRVSERDIKGTIIWQKNLPNMPMSVQALPRERYLVALQNMLLEMDREGNTSQVLVRNETDIVAAQRGKDGSYAILTNGNRMLRLDKTGKMINQFAIPGFTTVTGANFELLPNGKLLVPEYSNSRVVEYDEMGRISWQANVGNPSRVQRLPNGNTLVTQYSQRQVVEINKQGQIVWNKAVDGYIYYSSRR